MTYVATSTPACGGERGGSSSGGRSDAAPGDAVSDVHEITADAAPPTDGSREGAVEDAQPDAPSDAFQLDDYPVANLASPMGNLMLD